MEKIQRKQSLLKEAISYSGKQMLAFDGHKTLKILNSQHSHCCAVKALVSKAWHFEIWMGALQILAIETPLDPQSLQGKVIPPNKNKYFPLCRKLSSTAVLISPYEAKVTRFNSHMICVGSAGGPGKGRRLLVCVVRRQRATFGMGLDSAQTE